MTDQPSSHAPAPVAVAPAPLGASPTITDDTMLIALFLEQRAPSSRRVYGLTLAAFCRAMGVPLRQVTAPQILGWVQQLDGAPATRARKIYTLRALWAFGLQLGYFTTNPWTLVKPPVVADQLPARILSAEEVRALVAAARKNPYHLALVAVLLGTGCRISEIAGARWNDLALTLDGHLGLRVRGKGNKPRVVKIRPDVFQALARWRQVQGRPIDLDREDATPLFPHADGITPVSAVSLSRVILRLARRAGVRPSVTAHWLRHAHASYALLHGASLAQIQEALGHANISVTSRYLHAVQGLAETTADYIPFRFTLEGPTQVDRPRRPS